MTPKRRNHLRIKVSFISWEVAMDLAMLRLRKFSCLLRLTDLLIECSHQGFGIKKPSKNRGLLFKLVTRA